MLDTKVKFVLDNINTSRTKLIAQYMQKLDMYGKQDPTAGIYLEMLVTALSLSQVNTSIKIQHNLTLELYKKLNTLLRNNGLMFAIPDVPAPVPAASLPFLYGSYEKGMDKSIIPVVLTPDGETTGSRSLPFSPNMQVLYFAYPAVHGALQNIKDQNMYVITPGWLVRNEPIIIEGASYDYIIYEFKNYTTQMDFVVNFNF